MTNKVGSKQNGSAVDSSSTLGAPVRNMSRARSLSFEKLPRTRQAEAVQLSGTVGTVQTGGPQRDKRTISSPMGNFRGNRGSKSPPRRNPSGFWVEPPSPRATSSTDRVRMRGRRGSRGDAEESRTSPSARRDSTAPQSPVLRQPPTLAAPAQRGAPAPSIAASASPARTTPAAQAAANAAAVAAAQVPLDELMTAEVKFECTAWIEAARSFDLNEDFDLLAEPNSRFGNLSFPQLLAHMKAASAGKRTIQALADKLILSQMLENLGVPQMPVMFRTRSTGEALQAEVEKFIIDFEDGQFTRERLSKRVSGGKDMNRGSGSSGTSRHTSEDRKEKRIDDDRGGVGGGSLSNPQAENNGSSATRSWEPLSWDFVVKPVHLSDARGVLIFAQRDVQKGFTPAKLADHMEKCMGERAAENESAALRTLTPGIVVQPRYQSSVGFRAPLELRVTTVWGKARVGTWWWGRNAYSKDEAPHRNVWIVRRLKNPDSFSTQDTWEVLHNHPGGNAGFDEAVRIFERHVRAAAAIAEAIARAAGAPFLRADFFIGSPEWGVRLNEVAYGSGLDYRSRAPSSSVDSTSGASSGRAAGPGRVDAVPRLPMITRDDSPAIAYILQEGIALCSRRPATHFLSRLGAQGEAYRELTVSKYPIRTAHQGDLALAVALREALAAALTAWAERSAGDEPRKVPAEECVTPRAKSAPATPIVAADSTAQGPVTPYLALGCAGLMGSPLVGGTLSLNSPRRAGHYGNRLCDLQSSGAAVGHHTLREVCPVTTWCHSSSLVKVPPFSAPLTPASFVSTPQSQTALPVSMMSPTATQGLGSGSPFSFGDLPRPGRLHMPPPGPAAGTGVSRRAQPARLLGSLTTAIPSQPMTPHRNNGHTSTASRSERCTGPPVIRNAVA